MKLRKLSQALLVIFALGIFSIVSIVHAQKANPNIIVLVKGTPEVVFEPRQPLADCQKIDMYNAVTNKIIGDAVDCFENYVFADNGGFSLYRTTYFHFPQGELVAAGFTTAQPILAGSPGTTHIVGNIPAEGANNIVSGTHRFSGATGRVRLSGAVNLGVSFNCIFIIDID